MCILKPVGNCFQRSLGNPLCSNFLVCFVLYLFLYVERGKKIFLPLPQGAVLYASHEKLFCVTDEWKIKGLDSFLGGNLTKVVLDPLSPQQSYFFPHSLGWYLNLDELRQVMNIPFIFVLILNSSGSPRPSQPGKATQGFWTQNMRENFITGTLIESIEYFIQKKGESHAYHGVLHEKKKRTPKKKL